MGTLCLLLVLSGCATMSSPQKQSAPPPVAPSISAQPAAVTVTAGSPATFSVVATGTAPLTYQWMKGTTAISGATSTSYTTPATTTADNGEMFSVVVSNAASSVTSSAAMLTVNAAAVAPSITSQPVSESVTAGQTATFSVAATGTAPLSYQWKKGGVNIAGATSPSYTTPVTTSADNASVFSVVVSNSVNSITSSSATLTLTAAALAPNITTQPASGTVTAGATASFSVVATGTAPLSYQWKKNGTNIAGATSASYMTPATTVADSGTTFSVVVSNSVNSVSSGSATLTVNAAAVAPTITTQPAGMTVVAGQTATFTVVATGTAPLSYQWQKGGVNIAGATSASFTTPATTSADSGSTFAVEVTNSVKSVTSSSATLIVTPLAVAPTLTKQPANQTVTEGQTATFSVVAAGTWPLTYQWLKSGTAISGATSASYATPATTIADNGATFSVVVTNSVNSATSNSATLTVNASTTLPTEAEVLAAIEKVNNYWIANNAPGNANWEEATYFTGDLAAYDATGQTKYLTFAQTWASSHSYGLCSTPCGEGAGGNSTNNPDYQAAGEAYIRLYQLSNTASDITGISTSVSGMVNSTEVDEWNIPDDLNMSMPSFVELGVLNNDTAYFTRMYALYSNAKVTLGLWDTNTSLWWETPAYVNTTTYWSRGNGWAFAAHAKVLSVLPKSDPHYAEYLATYTAMAQALATRQQPGGYWNADLGGTDFAGPESSGTSFFVYGYAWGINNGILDRTTYLPIVVNGWNFLTNTATQSSGLFGYVQPVGSAPAPTTATTTEDFGVGAFLLAGRQMQLLVQ
jgi:rhamnogalacturonyl hydrolase YesR